MKTLRFLCLIFIVLFCNEIFANNLGVSPMKLVFEPNSKVASLNVVNFDNKDAVLQASLLRWTQSNGKDITTPTEDLLLIPPIVKIPASGHQVIRLALLKPHQMEVETAYRLIIHSVKSSVSSSANGAILFNFDASIPVFVMPAKVKHDPEWHIQKITDKEITIRVNNVGNVHERISKLVVLSKDIAIAENKSLVYVFPQQAYEWKIPINNGVKVDVNLPLSIDAYDDMDKINYMLSENTKNEKDTSKK